MRELQPWRARAKFVVVFLQIKRWCYDCTDTPTACCLRPTAKWANSQSDWTKGLRSMTAALFLQTGKQHHRRETSPSNLVSRNPNALSRSPHKMHLCMPLVPASKKSIRLAYCVEDYTIIVKPNLMWKSTCAWDHQHIRKHNQSLTPPQTEPKVLPHFQHLPTLTYAMCEHVLSYHINKITIIFEAILPLT